MKNVIKKIMIVELILMLASTIANVLYCMDKISREPVQTGFILVIFAGLGVNYFNMKAKNKGEKISVKRSPLEIAITLIIGIGWVISYGFTI